MIKEGSFESISGDSVGQAEQLEFISPDADRLHYLEQDIQSIGKFAKAVDSNDRTDDFLSNTDSEAAAGQLPPAVDPYICGEEARLLWPGTHTPATSPIPSDDEREKLQKVTVVQLSPKREKDVDSLLPPPFPPSMEFIDSAEVINDHEGMPVLPWGSGETRQSPRLSRSVRSPRSASPRGAIDDVSDDVSMFLSLETGRKSSSGLAPRSSLRAVPRDEEGAPLSFDSEPNIRRSSLKVTPIMSPAAKRPIERVGGAAFDIDISGSANPEVDLDGEEIILVRTSPRPSYRRLSGPPEDICVSRPDDIGNGSSPRVRSISSDHGATSPARSRQLEGVTEINLSSLLYVTEDSDEEVTPDESYSRATEVQMKTQSLQSETPIQMMHRKARLMLANSRSSDRKLINFSDLTDSSSKSVLSPINSTPSHQKISDLNSKITDGTAKNLFGTHGSDDLDSSGLDTNDVFTPSQWEYLSTLLEKAAEEESGVSPHRPAPPIVSSMFADRTDTASQMDKIAREKQQEKVVKAGHKLAVKILAKYFQRAQIDNNIEFLVTAWAKLLRNAKRAKKAAEDEEEVDEWTLRYKRFTQSREGAHLGLGLRLSAGKPQNYAQKPEPTRSVSVDRGLRRNNNGSSDYSAAATDGRGRRAKSPSTTPLATPRAADDGDVSLSQKGNLKKTFLSPLWIPPPDYELEAPVMPASASGRRSVRSGSKLELYNGSPRTVGSPRPSDRWGFGETPRAEKRNSFNESNILSSPETPSAIKSLRNPIKQEEEELRRQLMLHHQLHAQNSSGSLLGAMEDADGADSMSGASSIIPPPLDWSQVDLESLGVMPDQIVPTLKANEVMLSVIYFSNMCYL